MTVFRRYLALLLLLGASSGLLAQEVLDGIAAVVNGDVITFSQMRELVGARERALKAQYRGKELVDKIKEVRSAALNDLIDRQLIIQEFKKKKFTIPDYVLDEKIKQIIREEFGGDRQAFVRTLEAQGYSLAKFKEIEMEKVMVQAMRQQMASEANIVVSPQRTGDYYSKNRSEFSSPDQVKLRMIVLRGGPGGSPEKYQMAKEIREKIKEGASFEQMAQMYSEDSTQDLGGDWGWIDRKMLNEELTKVAFQLKAGEVSEVIGLEGSYYLLQVEARKNAKVKPLSEVREEIERKLREEAFRDVGEEWLADLREKAHIKKY